MTRPRTLVFMHGYMLDGALMVPDGPELNWAQVIWQIDSDGQPTLEGRAAMALKIGLEFGDKLVFGCDASDNGEGLTDGMQALLVANAFNTSSPALAQLVGGPYFNQSDLNTWLDQNASAGKGATTADECERAIRMCEEEGYPCLIHVSSAWHMPRCIAEMTKVAHRLREAGEFVPEIISVADHSSPYDVLIFEPPQRLDRSRPKWHRLARRLFSISEYRLYAAEHDFDVFLTEHGA